MAEEEEEAEEEVEEWGGRVTKTALERTLCLR